MIMKDLKEMNLEGLEKFTAALGEKPFRARQIRKWLFNVGVHDFEAMTDLSRDLRARISKTARISRARCLKIEQSEDGVRKFLWELDDGARVESVLIPERDYLTLCLSTQVGCAMGCRFCHTAMLGLRRNLTQAEIVNQILGVRESLPNNKKLKNIVFMGMGEPLANRENVVRAIKVMTEPGLMNLFKRRVSLSTVGLVPELKRLASEVTVSLTVSLNAADDKTRDFLMPVNRRYPLDELHQALAAFPLPSRRMITIAYVLLSGVNDSEQHARQLTRFMSGLRCKVNLIPFNPYPGAEFEAPPEDRIMAFQKALIAKHYIAIIRRSKGQDISAACGQLVGS
ncbi:MAG: 23S rRNA (adenine(2503)-C(2))-methyltransferase RlmN [Deltaproteobacteria bacterium]|nr:23S rRNA (adenine(2503)-C(2))-methyltransferase RlmN [Deltaproteobacteria bacterium]